MEITKIIDAYYNGEIDDNLHNTLNKVIEMLNAGKIRCINDDYSVNETVKKAILLIFKHFASYPQVFDGFDKIGLLAYDRKAKYRKVPGAFIRNGVYIAKNCVIMPSCINIGAYIDAGTMIDMNSTIGSCAQIGKNCHISAGSCIGGVLEPVVAGPVIVEDNCLIGANAAVLEGVIVEHDSVVAPGTVLSKGIRIIDRETNEQITNGVIPANSLVVPGSYQSGKINVNCAVIVKKNTTYGKHINDELRIDTNEHGNEQI